MLSIPAHVVAALTSASHLGMVGEVTTGGKAHPLGVVGYNVTADEASVARYMCDVDLPPTTDPRLLDPYGAVLRLWHRLAPPGLPGVDVPAGVYRLTSRASRRPDDSLRVQGAGFETRVERDQFTSPRIVMGASAAGEIRTLITQTLPDAIVDVRGGLRDKRVPKVTYTQSRWGAIRADDNSLARSIGAQVFCDASGRWRIQPGPRLSDEAVWECLEGPGGALVTSDAEVTDADVRNVWVVTGERTDGSPVVKALVSDDDPGSPTYAGGVSKATGDVFGRFVEHVSTPLVESDYEAREYGQARLATSTGLSESLSLTAVPHPGLEVHDVIETTTGQRRSKRIVSRLGWSGDADGAQAMTVATRVLRREFA